jgi:type II secretory pathway pseudopilin PulG
MPVMKRSSQGFTYIGILIAVAVIGIFLAAAGTLWSFSAQREKEAELLFVGHQYRNAIAHYRAAAGGGTQLPRELQDLLQDERSPVPRRFLRKLYPDPMTGKDDWTLIRTENGGIIGVASSSAASPIKKKNFDLADDSFEDKECYCDWQFVFSTRFNVAPRKRGLPAD